MRALKFIAAILFLSLPLFAYATSGACSYHGGVNCAAGADYDGSVICNDGWTDSSVSYYSMIECQGYNSTPTCPINSTYDSLSRSCKCYSGYVVSGGQCISGNSYCWNNYGYNSSFDYLSKTCSCDSGYSLDSSGQCTDNNTLCHQQVGYNSRYNSLTDKCQCNSGYLLQGGRCVYDDSSYDTSSSYVATPTTCPSGYISYASQCISETQACQILNGTNSYASGGKCYCSSGYQYDSTQKICVLSPTTQTTYSAPSAPDSIDVCIQKYGPHGIVAGQNKCGCADGYVLNDQQNNCIEKAVEKAVAQPTADAATPTQNSPVTNAVKSKSTPKALPTQTASTTIATSTATTSESAPPAKKPFWQSILGWFKWW